MGTVDPESFDTLHSYANAFEMPFVTPWFPESMYSSSPKVREYFSKHFIKELHSSKYTVIIIYIFLSFKYFGLYKNLLLHRIGNNNLLFRLGQSITKVS